ncbi:MAG: DsbA family oxidoreductase [Polyangia bacterium]
MNKLRVDVWSDIACPWCYIGKRRLERALAAFSNGNDVEVTWRAFELDPDAPKLRDPSVTQAQRIAEKYGMPVDVAEERLRDMTQTAKEDGLDFRFDAIRGGNTFDGHRLIHFATERGLGGAMKERILRAYMTEGQAVSDHDVLVTLATEVGLDGKDVRAMLTSDACADAVRADEREAQALGIRGVPFFVVDGRYGVSGAQPAEKLLEVLNKAWSELPEGEVAEGAVCGPDGCA